MPRRPLSAAYVKAGVLRPTPAQLDSLLQGWPRVTMGVAVARPRMPVLTSLPLRPALAGKVKYGARLVPALKAVLVIVGSAPGLLRFASRPQHGPAFWRAFGLTCRNLVH